MEFRNNLLAYGECSESYGEQSCHGLLRELFYRLDIVDPQALPVDPILPIASSRMTSVLILTQSCAFLFFLRVRGVGFEPTNP